MATTGARMGPRESIGSCCVEGLDMPVPATGAAAVRHQLSLCGRGDPAQQVTPGESLG